MIKIFSSTHVLFDKLKIGAALLAFALGLSYILWALPFSDPKLNITLWSDTDGISQLFLNNGKGYSEENSIRQPMIRGYNKLSYTLSESLSPVRWDPVQQTEESATLVVYDCYISILGLEILSNRLSIRPTYQIAEVRSLKENTIIRLQKDANDPQLGVVLNADAIEKFRIISSVGWSFLVSFVLGLILIFRKKLVALTDCVEQKVEILVDHIKRQNFTFREFGILIFIGALSNIYFLANFSFSIDDENGALRDNAVIWIGQGRWTSYLIERFLFPQSAIPYAPYIVLIACLAISYSLIIRAHSYPINWKTYGCYTLFCTFPTWWFISEFYSNVPAVSVGVLLASLSAYLTYLNSRSDQLDSTSSLSINAVIITSLACAIGAYQSLILLYLTIVSGIALTKITRSDESLRPCARQIFKKALRVSLLTICSLFLYAFINYVAQKISVVQSPYINGFIKIDQLIQSPLLVLATTFQEQWKFYSGDSILFGASMPLASILLLLATIIVIYTGRRKIILSILIWFFVLSIPFALHLLSGGDGMPVRSMLALPYVIWLMGIILISQKRVMLMIIGIIVVIFFQLEIIGVTSQYIASANITQAHDRMLAADIYRRIGELGENFDRKKPIKIDVYGHKKFTTVYASGWSSTAQGSFFDWDQGSLFRMTNYMKVMGFQNIAMAEDSERQQLTQYFLTMPSWPASGSVKKVGDYYLVKLSQDPDPFHAESVTVN